jgi:hypothetical protein
LLSPTLCTGNLGEGIETNRAFHLFNIRSLRFHHSPRPWRRTWFGPHIVWRSMLPSLLRRSSSLSLTHPPSYWGAIGGKIDHVGLSWSETRGQATPREGGQNTRLWTACEGSTCTAMTTPTLPPSALPWRLAAGWSRSQHGSNGWRRAGSIHKPSQQSCDWMNSRPAHVLGPWATHRSARHNNAVFILIRRQQLDHWRLCRRRARLILF